MMHTRIPPFARIAWVMLAATAFASTGQACGPDFPMSLLENRQSALGYAPEGSLEFELKHLSGYSKDPASPANTRFFGSRTEAEAQGLNEAQVAAIASMREASSAPAALLLAANLPIDVGLYTAGAVAWSLGNIEESLALFRAVSALAPAERAHRGVWSAFMEGRAHYRLKDLAEAARAFERTRHEAATGAADPLLLSVESLGEQARVLRESGDPIAAVHLYMEQAARGGAGAIDSLRIVAKDAVLDPATFDVLSADPQGRKLLVAYLFARSAQLEEAIQWDRVSYERAMSAESAREQVAAVIDKLLALPPEAISTPDRVAALAYRVGEYDKAAQWAERSAEPLATWVRAKLALRNGDMDSAAKFYAEAAAVFPTREEAAGSEYFTWNRLYEPPSCSVNAEAGVLALSRGEYVQALALLYQAGNQYWRDAAYVAERVLTLDELRSFVDRVAPSADDVQPADEVEVENSADIFYPGLGPQIRWLFARRSMREGNTGIALAYFDDPELQVRAKQYAALLEDTESRGDTARARAWFKLAKLTRHWGLELLGFEGDPDYAMYEGQFDLYPDWQDESEPGDADTSESHTSGSEVLTNQGKKDQVRRRTDLPVRGPFTSDGERERISRTRAKPLERFHYRLVAADYASKAADLLPPRSQAFAAVLCEATSWLINRNNDQAQLLYRRYIAEGALVPWGERFGQDCPSPDFWKVERQKYVQLARDAAVPVLAVIAVIAGGLLAIVWRRRRRL